MVRIVCCSGGFDPVHVGHVRLFKEARALGDRLVVILNNDEFLMRKKGYIFMPLQERKEILESIKYVDEVVVSIDKDDSVSETLRLVKPNIYAKSGDRQGRSEAVACQEINCQRVFGLVPGEMKNGKKCHSSTEIVNQTVDAINKRYLT